MRRAREDEPTQDAEAAAPALAEDAGEGAAVGDAPSDEKKEGQEKAQPEGAGPAAKRARSDGGGAGGGGGGGGLVRGVLVSCSTGREGRAIPEALNLLNHYADQWERLHPEFAPPPPPQQPPPGPDGPQPAAEPAPPPDLLASLAAEVAALRAPGRGGGGSGGGGKGPAKRFYVDETRVKGLVLMRAAEAWAGLGPDLVAFVEWLLAEMAGQGERTRFVARLVPLQAVGPVARLAEVAAAALAAGLRRSEPVSFVVEYRCRNNEGCRRADIVREVAALVGYPHFVCAKSPQRTVLVEIFNRRVGVSVVRRYHELARFNVQGQPPPPPPPAAATKNHTAPPQAEGLPAAAETVAEAEEKAEAEAEAERAEDADHTQRVIPE